MIFLASPLYAQSPTYVGSQNCTDCHAEETEAWATSHHAKAWMEPTPSSVLGDFNDARFDHDDMQVSFTKEGDDYIITVTETDGKTTTYPVHSVAGIAPLQQYLLETEDGRQQSFDVTWDDVEKRWYHLYPDQDLPPDDGLHWSGPYKTWNARCAECHATDYQRNYIADTRSYQSAQAEIGVGCEACHGPASEHLKWANNATKRADLDAQDLDAYGFAFSFDSDNPETGIQQCAGCHSRREALTNGNPIPGTPFHDTYRLALLRPGLYHPDGQILDEVYVYGSFLQSKMYARGVGCMNCHDPHKAEIKIEGNALCTQCHSEAGNTDFPTLTLKNYDTPEHHKHLQNSDGAQCNSCHMIERIYMGIDGRRDHSFRIPRPDLHDQTGAPDACTDCHADRTPDWAAQTISDWYPDSRHRTPHYGTVFAQAQVSPELTGQDLQALALDPEQAGIVRATALYLLQPVADQGVTTIMASLLNDPDPLVRESAAQLQSSAAPEARVARLLPLLEDPRRAVRSAAAKQLLNVSPALMQSTERKALSQGMAEWQNSMSTRLDFPETHLVLGGMALTMRNAAAATQAFGEVVRLDPQRAEAWPMLVRLAHISGGVNDALAIVEEALTYLPDDPTLRGMRDELAQ
ncbi:multiheme c-type cytochrome [Roseovarius sp. EL26]|uniref:multiheme c-type cytochrome n=1 Tax=Roseovarius sp. EL26 TaxID=2126672 RepID=UPI0020B16639|nr:multiheme c-type cytochrome [Roseovarius sp. EL26]